MAAELDRSVNQRFSSRLGLLLSAIGVAVGTGNIWRFPRIVAQNGGAEGAGAFLVSWVIFLFLWSIPLIISEYALGSKNRAGVVATIARTAGKKLAWMGAFIAFVSTAIMFYYAVVVGWCLYYFFHTIFTPLPMGTEAAMAAWNTFQGSPWPFIFHAAAMGLGMLAIWKGIASIEWVNRIMIPTLLLIVVLAVVRALTLPGAWSGVAYLFKPEWGQLLRPKVWLEALTQNAWDTGAGWGLFLTYAAYMKKEHGVVKNAFITGIGNNSVSLLAALMVFGTVFAVLQTEMGMAKPEILEIMKTSGPASTGLTFIWMPQLFARMILGRPMSLLFFLGLFFASFTSLISMLELPTRVLVDAGMKRKRAIVLVTALCYLLGIPSAMNLTFLSNQDFVWGIALMISGAFVAYTIVRCKARSMRTSELVAPCDWKLGRWWDWVITYFVPVAAVTLLVWWLALSATVYAPDQWYNPKNPFSVMTCLAQWGAVIVVFLLLNRWLGRKFGER